MSSESEEVDEIIQPNRWERLKATDLIGCLNDSGITSENYKEIMNDIQ